MRSELGVDAPPVKSPERQMPSGPEDADVARTPGRLDLKLLRLAVHGWWLGNPLVYKPGTADLGAVARELAGAGARRSRGTAASPPRLARTREALADCSVPVATRASRSRGTAFTCPWSEA